MDKLEKLRKEVERLQNELIQEKEKGFGSDTDDACILELQNVLTYIDSLQEEPVSIWHDASEKSNEPEEVDNPCKIRKNLQKDIVIVLNGQRHRQVWHKGCFSKKECKEKCSLYERCQRCCIDLCMIFFHDPHCHFVEEPVSEDLEQAIDNYLATYWGGEKEKQDWPFLKKMAIHFANWQKKKDQKSMEIMDEVYFKSCDMIRKQMIDKACKYLQDHREEVETEDNGISGWISDEFIEKFKRQLKSEK